MTYGSDTRVNEIALSGAGARQILEHAGIDYCCGGGKSLRDACLAANVPAEEILRELQESGSKFETDESRWTEAPLAELTKHIREEHHQYVRRSIPRLRALLAKIREKHGGRHRELGEIEKLFGDVARELLAHMQKEEQILFPFIESMEHAGKNNAGIELPFFRTVRNPIHAMMMEHDNAGELVRRIRAQSNGYMAPADACTSYQAAYQELQAFEKDLHLHVHLENNILFPRAVEMEVKAAA
ncbi:MAG TPA: iron-sulfur cluster repair di-iron protein [Candidatus Acidoferrum sp.]|nr:iron-sulfur cluster repair di-iron protein [Candidatus Acidoferrum sp.]